MILKRTTITWMLSTLLLCHLHAQKVDYSIVSVPEETGIEFRQVTTPNDYVCMPIVKRTAGKINWLSNRVIDISPNGNNIAYLSYRNNTTNIFVKEFGKADQRSIGRIGKVQNIGPFGPLDRTALFA